MAKAPDPLVTASTLPALEHRGLGSLANHVKKDRNGYYVLIRSEKKLGNNASSAFLVLPSVRRSRRHDLVQMTDVEIVRINTTAGPSNVVDPGDQRQQEDEVEAARTLGGVAVELHNATLELAELALAHADGVERRGDEIDTMLAKIRSSMATSAE